MHDTLSHGIMYYVDVAVPSTLFIVAASLYNETVSITMKIKDKSTIYSQNSVGYSGA